MGGGTVGGRKATGDYGTQALLATRARFFVLYRLATRLLQVKGHDGGAHHSGAWQLLLVGFVALDVVMWVSLRDPRRFAFKSRLAIDAIDIGVWSVAPYPRGATYDVAVFAGVPLAMEAGLRSRWSALAVPAAGLVATGLARTAAGLPWSAFTVSWLLLGVAAGVSARDYDRRLRRHVDGAWGSRRSADMTRAFLAGQNSIAMGASSVVDGIESIVPLLGAPPPVDSALGALASGWKANLGLSTRALSGAGTGTAIYLGDALAEWSTEYNRHPDLSSRVELTLPEGSGTLLLTGDQATALQRLLTDLHLRGRYRVEPENPDAETRPPGRALPLRVGAHRVVVPADRRPAPPPCDPAPLMFMLVAAQIGREMSPAAAYLPAAVALGGIGCCVAASMWSHARLKEHGVAARRPILGLALIIAAGYAVVSDLTMRHPLTAGGGVIYTFGEGLLVVLLLLGMYEAELDGTWRWLAAASVGVIVLLGWYLHPGHAQDPYPYLLLLQPWLLTVYLCGRKLSGELRSTEAVYAAELHAGDVAAGAEVFRRGQIVVLELVRQARDDAGRQLAEARPKLDERVFELAYRRLEQVHERLRGLGGR